MRPSDWNSLHNQVVNLAGNTSGTNQVTGTDVVFAGGNNITLNASQGVNVGTISIQGLAPVTLSSYVPFEVQGFGSTSASVGTASSGVASFWPISVNDYVAVDRMNILVSMNFVSSSVSGRQTGGLVLGIYTRGNGASNTQLSQLDSAAMNWSVTGSSASYTINYPTATNSVGFTTGSTSSGAVGISSIFTGLKMLQIPIGSTLSPGVYWIGAIGTASSTSANLGLQMSLVGVSDSQLTNLAPMGSLSANMTGTNATAQNGMGQWFPGQGTFTSAGQTNLPASVALSAITAANMTVFPVMKFWST